MTDSVKYSAFSERILRAVLAIWSGVGLASAGLVIMDFQAREGLYGRTPDGKGDAGAVSAGSVPAGAAVDALAECWAVRTPHDFLRAPRLSPPSYPYHPAPP